MGFDFVMVCVMFYIRTNILLYVCAAFLLLLKSILFVYAPYNSTCMSVFKALRLHCMYVHEHFAMCSCSLRLLVFDFSLFVCAPLLLLA
jgi:hypothetical protein